jgi:hypothetical protein
MLDRKTTRSIGRDYLSDLSWPRSVEDVDLDALADELAWLMANPDDPDERPDRAALLELLSDEVDERSTPSHEPDLHGFHYA